MKWIISVFIIFTCLHFVFGQWNPELSIGYTFASPFGQMKQNINQGNGVIIDFHLLSPSKKFSLGADFNYTIYGFDQSRQQYTFSDGTTADMDINVTNSFINLMAVSRYYLLTDKKVLPFIEGKVGYSWFSTELNINDPDEFDSCKPVEKDILQKDGTIIYSFGGGFRYDLSSLFKKMKRDYVFVNLAAFYTQGGQVSYMNTDAPMSNASMPSTRTGDIEATFINTQTQVIHKHLVGYLYTSFDKMMDVRLTFTFRLGY